MRISDIIREQDEHEVTRVGPTEVVIKDPKSGIETKIPKRPNQPGTIQRDKEGKLVFDPETPGDVADDIEQGEKINTKPTDSQGTQGTQGTV